MKKIITLAMCAVLLCGVFAPSLLTETAAAAADGSKPPEIKAESAIIYCADTGEVVWEKDSGKQMEPASMTKLMTCLLAAENLEPDRVVTVTEEATDVIPTMMYLQAGEKITVEELMYAALLSSANDAAAALAIETAGSIESFAGMMNERAAELGCSDTCFVNPHGLSAEGQLTTASDMALIAHEALSNETVRKISGTVEHTVPETNMYPERHLKNFNMFLYGGTTDYGGEERTVEKYDGVFGGKTGSLSESYCTMVTGLETGGVEVYSVIMGTSASSRFDDMKKLLDYGSENVANYAAFKKGEVLGKVRLTGGAVNRAEAVAAEAGYVHLPDGAADSLVTTEYVYTDNLTAPVMKGQKVGEANIYIAGELYRTVDILAGEDVEEGWFLSGLGISNLQTVIICAVTAAAAAFLLTVVILRVRNKKRRLMIRREKLREEARRQLEREEDHRKRNWNF